MPAISMAQKNNKSHKLLVTGLSPQVNDALELDRGSSGSCESLDFSQSDDDEIDSSYYKNYDAVIFDILKVAAEDFARQLTVKDLPLFKAITPEELSSCGWTKKDKMDLAPNIVAFTRRFNHVSFWVIREILSANKPKIRAAIMGHFIKIAKRLYELNNLHSLKAVLAGLQSAPVFRLTRTWVLINRKDRSTFDKLGELVSEEENRARLREHLNSTRLPCIPYLGMYLTDLTYVDTIHPNTGGLDDERTRKMNDIIRIIAEFQQSVYENMEPIKVVQEYLESIKYIEELQKFVEDRNYKLSLQIEPKSAASSSGRTKSASRSRESLDVNYNTSSGSVVKFVPGHRKSYSLGTNSVLSSASGLSTDSLSISIASSTGSRNLLDDSLDDRLSTKGLTDSELSLDRTSSHAEDSIFFEGGEESTLCAHESDFVIEGYMKRKKCLRNGKKLAVSSWQKFWVGLRGALIYYYLPKHRHLGTHERSAFKSSPHKVVEITDWQITLQCDAYHDIFHLTDAATGNSYKFHAGSQSKALMWYTYLQKATKYRQQKVPQNLMSFEESEEHRLTSDVTG